MYYNNIHRKDYILKNLKSRFPAVSTLLKCNNSDCMKECSVLQVLFREESGFCNCKFFFSLKILFLNN